jgi:hypothetical protein
VATYLKGRRKGTTGKLSKSGGKIVYTETWLYCVISDIINESPLNVINTPGLPQIEYSSAPNTGGICVCTGLDPKQNAQSPYVWEVTVEFSTDTKDQDTNNNNPDPTQWKPLYEGKVETYPEVMYQDFSPTPLRYVNSAKSKFPEPLIVNRPIIVYDFFQYEPATLTDIAIGDRNDTINDAAARNGMFPKYSLKCTISNFERGWFYNTACVRVNYSIAYKKSLWLNKPLDVGYEYYSYDSAQNKWSKLTSDFLVALNTNGTKRADNADADFLEFISHRPIPFTFLR